MIETQVGGQSKEERVQENLINNGNLENWISGDTTCLPDELCVVCP